MHKHYRALVAAVAMSTSLCQAILQSYSVRCVQNCEKWQLNIIPTFPGWRSYLVSLVGPGRRGRDGGCPTQWNCPGLGRWHRRREEVTKVYQSHLLRSPPPHSWLQNIQAGTADSKRLPANQKGTIIAMVYGVVAISKKTLVFRW